MLMARLNSNTASCIVCRVYLCMRPRVRHNIIVIITSTYLCMRPRVRHDIIVIITSTYLCMRPRVCACGCACAHDCVHACVCAWRGMCDCHCRQFGPSATCLGALVVIHRNIHQSHVRVGPCCPTPVHIRVRACVHACVRTCMRAFVRVCAHVHACACWRTQMRLVRACARA